MKNSKNCSFKVDKSASKLRNENEYPIALVIRKDRKRKKIYLKIYAKIESMGDEKKDASDWDNDFQRFHVKKEKR